MTSQIIRKKKNTGGLKNMEFRLVAAEKRQGGKASVLPLKGCCGWAFGLDVPNLMAVVFFYV